MLLCIYIIGFLFTYKPIYFICFQFKAQPTFICLVLYGPAQSLCRDRVIDQLKKNMKSLV